MFKAFYSALIYAISNVGITAFLLNQLTQNSDNKGIIIGILILFLLKGKLVYDKILKNLFRKITPRIKKIDRIDREVSDFEVIKADTNGFRVMMIVLTIIICIFKYALPGISTVVTSVCFIIHFVVCFLIIFTWIDVKKETK